MIEFVLFVCIYIYLFNFTYPKHVFAYRRGSAYPRLNTTGLTESGRVATNRARFTDAVEKEILPLSLHPQLLSTAPGLVKVFESSQVKGSDTVCTYSYFDISAF
jgi:hypothetical protein